MSDHAPAKKEKAAPAWVMTFADLMSLLMCFFVLLLSFSEMDVSKYKEMAGSMANAFGVQREIQVREPPKGINVIAREFSPGRPEPTPLNVIRQMTTTDFNVNLDLGKERRRPVPTSKAKHEPDQDKNLKPADQAEGLTETQKQELEKAKQLAAVRIDQKLMTESELTGMQSEGDKRGSVDQKSLEELVKAKAAAEERRKLERRAKLISNALGREIKAGSVDVETAGQKIIIRVREKASFGSGRADLKEAFRPLLARVAKILKGSQGKIIVAGHTDNIPIYTERFRSNWELSAARAVSVAHEMMLATDIPSERFLVQGFADTEPMVKNNSVANRAKNRRVEIILQQGQDKESGERSISGAKPPAGKAPDLQSRRQQRQTVAKPAAAPKTPLTSDAKRRKPVSNAAGIKVGGSQRSSKSQAAPVKPKPKTPSSMGIKAAGSQ